MKGDYLSGFACKCVKSVGIKVCVSNEAPGTRKRRK